ncbi:UPF0738 family protein [Planococcus lenghuensis]|uniref:Uncharacterized protein n=1 Tax=Planococcus lenghuensis TaxID=2213202 RepID=A0A1Q2L0F9_9BACL|nr:hypothetical protein [Planococcus lenghuensis]AQQ53903.1 hypothetical protein B0X71_12915 [Planococcus lenghuensis]
MHKFADISSAKHDELESRFYINEEEPFQLLEATGEMTADPENGAIIYRLSTGKKAVYVRFERKWNHALAVALQQDRLPSIVWGNQTIPLLQFHEELLRLLDSADQTETAFPAEERELFREAVAFRRRGQ